MTYIQTSMKSTPTKTGNKRYNTEPLEVVDGEC